jgi:hypothetical protein
MSATLEPVVTICGRAQVWIARSGPEHVMYGDPYVVAFVVIRVDDTMARIEALASDDPHVQREVLGVRKLLAREGFTSVMWQRIHNQQAALK